MKLLSLSIIYFLLSLILGFTVRKLPPMTSICLRGKQYIIVIWPFISVFGIASVVLGTVFYLDLPKETVAFLWWPFIASFPAIFIGAQLAYRDTLKTKA